jgi:hypothetical protein
MSANIFRYYGVTTARIAVAVSTTVGVTAGPGIIDMMLSGVTGAGVYMAGTSLAVASMVSGGAFFPTGTQPTHIGIPPFFLASGGTAAEVSVTKFLTDPGVNAGASIYAY